MTSGSDTFQSDHGAVSHYNRRTAQETDRQKHCLRMRRCGAITAVIVVQEHKITNGAGGGRCQPYCLAADWQVLATSKRWTECGG